ncbi:MAG: ArsR family transcriptional regulator [Spirochaetia bacterium]|nr:ArsR family transcriptional regulator [Spirochaetia bacterium]
MDITSILKLLSDEVRLRIINILNEGTLCVGEIQTILDIKQSNASRHLEKLKNSELVIYKKDAQWIYYKINKSYLDQYPFINSLLKENINKDKLFSKDLLRLKKYKECGLTCQDLRNINFNFEEINFNIKNK